MKNTDLKLCNNVKQMLLLNIYNKIPFSLFCEALQQCCSLQCQEERGTVFQYSVNDASSDHSSSFLNDMPIYII